MHPEVELKCYINLQDRKKAFEFLEWAEKNDIRYTLKPTGYDVLVEFHDIFQVLQWK